MILDKILIDKYNLNIYDLADKLAYYGVDFLQFRFKNISDYEALKMANQLSKIIHKRKKTFIINDRVDIAYACKANGVHLGNNDLPSIYARKILGKNKIIGKTVHNRDEFIKAKREPVDYLSVGAIFPSSTKPQVPQCNLTDIKKAIKNCKKTVFLIGGINLDNINTLLEKGFKNIAICQSIILSKNIKKTVQAFKRCLKKVF